MPACNKQFGKIAAEVLTRIALSDLPFVRTQIACSRAATSPSCRDVICNLRQRGEAGKSNNIKTNNKMSVHNKIKIKQR
jgi:hypothetical protein